MKRRRGFIVVAVVTAVFAVAVTGCEEIADFLGFKEDDVLASEPGYDVFATTELPFSGRVEENGDSAIDLIRDFAAAGNNSLYLTLVSATEPIEQIKLDAVADLSLNGLGLDSSNSPKKLAINGSGRTIDLIGPASDAPVITVGQGVTLTLENITLKGLVSKDNKNPDNKLLIDHILGGTDDENNRAPVIAVVDGGTLVLNAGVVITENENINNIGGVYVAGGGTLVMNDGVLISHNFGGGVSVDGGKFTMNGGTIWNNTGGMGGGVSLSCGQFDMVNGTIEENRAYRGGGVSIWKGSNFTMRNGSIIKNKATTNGGGVSSYSPEDKFTMYNGVISGNETVEQLNGESGGGGVYMYGQFTMENGSIENNSAAHHGGGVFVHITGNFFMKGGTISGNKFSVAYPDGKGGGVYVKYDGEESVGSFQKTGGTIYGVVSAKENEWEAKDKQNYYKVQITGPKYDKNKSIEANLTHTEGPKDRGYVVYYMYYADGADLSFYRDRTAGPDVKLETKKKDTAKGNTDWAQKTNSP